MIIKFVRALIAGLLCLSSMAHIANPYVFIGTIDSYNLTSPSLSVVIGTLFPVQQLIVAMALCTKQFSQSAALLAAFMFTAFLVAQISIVIRGNQISCGCFGDFSMDIGVGTIAFTTFLLLGISTVYWNDRTM
jgi:putative oxidoreductase